MPNQTKASPRISSDAVQKRTGKSWAEWFDLLDRDAAHEMTHTHIAAHLGQHYDLPSWWRQMVAVGYEQARGLRDRHERPDGYQINRSKTIAVPVASLYAAWKLKRQRQRWLADADYTITTANSNRSLRIIWVDSTTRLHVQFAEKGHEKSQVNVEHARLLSAQEAERMKAYWGEQLERLKHFLEK